jgi:hypothetical protein
MATQVARLVFKGQELDWAKVDRVAIDRRTKAISATVLLAGEEHPVELRGAYDERDGRITVVSLSFSRPWMDGATQTFGLLDKINAELAELQDSHPLARRLAALLL